MAKKKRPPRSAQGDPSTRAEVEPAASPSWHKRRAALATLVVLLTFLAAGGWIAWRVLSRGAVPEVRRTGDQNVLLITIDTWRADALGASGSGQVATPNLDRLAALGTRFDFAHAHAVITLPSHASILTGLYPFQHGVRENAGFRLASSTTTLATRMKKSGMATGAFIGSFALDSRFGLNTGFDVYDERYGKSEVASGFNMAERRADAVVASAVSWIRQQKGRWLAWVHVFDPHAPYDPPPPFNREYADRPYYGEVAFTDAALGPLLDAARDANGRPTLIVVTGDHGEGLGDHGELTHGLFAYEATLRVPLIVAQVDRSTPSWAESRPKPDAAGLTMEAGAEVRRHGHASDLPARHVDIVPTILEALHLTQPDGLPGKSLLPGSPGSEAGDRASYFEALSASLNRGWAPLTGVLSDRQKYIDLPLPELYNLGTDPGEAANLVDREAERRRALEAALRGFKAVGVAERRTEDAEARERLQALGYVTGTAAAKAHYTENDDPKRLIGLDQQLRNAVEMYERRQPAAAIPIYRRIIAERPGMEVTYAQLSMLMWELGQPADAIETLRAALRAGVGSIAIRTKLGIYLTETGNLREALPLLEEVTTTDSNDLDALNALGIAYGKSGRLKDAAAVFDRILQLNPSNTMALENLGSIALSEGRWAEARRSFSQVLQVDPASAQAHNGLGVVELKAGNRAGAIEQWKQAVAHDPENYDALYNLATELVNAGQAETARPYLEQFARTAPAAFYAADIGRVRNMLKGIGR